MEVVVTFKYLDKCLNTIPEKQAFYTNGLLAGTFCRKKRSIYLLGLRQKSSCYNFVAPIYPVMQKLFDSHSLKMGLRLIVVLLLSFILVNLFA